MFLYFLSWIVAKACIFLYNYRIPIHSNYHNTRFSRLNGSIILYLRSPGSVGGTCISWLSVVSRIQRTQGSTHNTQTTSQCKFFHLFYEYTIYNIHTTLHFTTLILLSVDEPHTISAFLLLKRMNFSHQNIFDD